MPSSTLAGPVPAPAALPPAPLPDGPRVVVETVAEAPLDRVWEAFVAVPLPAIFPRRRGPIPAVRATEGQQGRWDVVGRSRLVHLGDGRTVREAITLSEPSEGAAPEGGRAAFGYRVAGFTGPLGAIAREAHGRWRFEADGPRRTRIAWTYVFVPTGPLGALPLRVVVGRFWRPVMRDGIEALRRICEAA